MAVVALITTKCRYPSLASTHLSLSLLWIILPAAMSISISLSSMTLFFSPFTVNLRLGSGSFFRLFAAVIVLNYEKKKRHANDEWVATKPVRMMLDDSISPLSLSLRECLLLSFLRLQFQPHPELNSTQPSLVFCPFHWENTWSKLNSYFSFFFVWGRPFLWLRNKGQPRCVGDEPIRSGTAYWPKGGNSELSSLYSNEAWSVCASKPRFFVVQLHFKWQIVVPKTEKGHPGPQATWAVVFFIDALYHTSEIQFSVIIAKQKMRYKYPYLNVLGAFLTHSLTFTCPAALSLPHTLWCLRVCLGM